MADRPRYSTCCYNPKPAALGRASYGSSDEEEQIALAAGTLPELDNTAPHSHVRKEQTV